MVTRAGALRGKLGRGIDVSSGHKSSPATHTRLLVVPGALQPAQARLPRWLSLFKGAFAFLRARVTRASPGALPHTGAA